MSITLHFHGPFKFTSGENYLFNSEFAKDEGIYIWTIKDEKNNVNYVHYIGETSSFGKRQREHLLSITGLNYRIIDPFYARQGIEKIVWNGMWRDRSSTAFTTLLENYNEVSKTVIEYIGIINIYFAPTTIETYLRKHIEGCLGYNFRKNYPDLKIFYPDDNRVATKVERLGEKLILVLDDEIAGIDKEQTI
jgi:hypothetical protein